MVERTARRRTRGSSRGSHSSRAKNETDEPADQRKSSKRAKRTASVASQLGLEQWGQRLRRLLRFAPEGTTEEQATKALEECDGDVGQAIPAIGGVWIDSSVSSESENESEGEGCHGCGNPNCGEIIGESLDPLWWDKRFEEDIEDGTVSEWLCSFEVCGHLLLPELNKQARSLVLGCGNSEFTEHLHNAGMSHTVNIDISQVVIDHMRAKHADCKGMSWEIEDATSMSYKQRSFEQIVDKSLLDCMFCADDDVQESCISQMIAECFRVLKRGGVALFVTKQSPEMVAKKLGWEDYDSRWYGFDWEVEAKRMYVPFVDEAGLIDNDSVAVFDPLELTPEKRQYGFKLIYLYVARKSK